MDRIVSHITSLPDQPAADTAGGVELARALKESMPEEGRPLPELLDLLFDRAVPKSFNAAGPGYLAYIPGGGLFPAAVADLIASAVNRYVGVFAAAPGLAQLEANVVRWFCDLVGYPATAGGFLTSGGSLSIFSALVTARRERLPESFLAGALYVTSQTHAAVAKAAMLAGFPAAAVREVPSDGAYRMRADILREQMAKDRAEGLTPFLVVASAGTTNTGAVDDLHALADVTAAEGAWLHVDAAYGGFFLLTARGRHAMAGIERADSVTLDPHKGLFLPYGTGSLVVREKAALARAHTVSAHYLPHMQEEDDLVDFCQISPELSRSFRGLRAWLPLKLWGAAAFRECLDEKLDLAAWATEELRGIAEMEIVAEPQLSLLAFRWAPPGRSEEATSALNRELLARVNARNRVHLTGTLLGGRFVLRICVLSFRTHRDRMEMALEDIRSALAELKAL